MTTSTILLVDDNPAMRAAVATIFGDEPDLCICGEAHDIGGALAHCETLKPDLALIDISLRGEDGLDLVRRFARDGFAVRPVVFSLHNEAHYIDDAREAGALGYICKTDEPAAMLAAVRRVLAGESHFPGRGA